MQLMRIRYPAIQNAVMDREYANNQVIPGEWVLGKVTPIHKSGNRFDQKTFGQLLSCVLLAKFLKSMSITIFTNFC